MRLGKYLCKGSCAVGTASPVTIVTHLRLVHQDKNRFPQHTHTPDIYPIHEYVTHTSMSAHKRILNTQRCGAATTK